MVSLDCVGRNEPTPGNHPGLPLRKAKTIHPCTRPIPKEPAPDCKDFRGSWIASGHGLNFLVRLSKCINHAKGADPRQVALPLPVLVERKPWPRKTQAIRRGLQNGRTRTGRDDALILHRRGASNAST